MLPPHHRKLQMISALRISRVEYHQMLSVALKFLVESSAKIREKEGVLCKIWTTSKVVCMLCSKSFFSLSQTFKHFKAARYFAVRFSSMAIRNGTRKRKLSNPQNLAKKTRQTARKLSITKPNPYNVDRPRRDSKPQSKFYFGAG